MFKYIWPEFHCFGLAYSDDLCTFVGLLREVFACDGTQIMVIVLLGR